ETQEITKEDKIGNLSVKRVYSKDSKTTIWRQNKKKKKDEKKFQNNDISFITKKLSNMLFDAEASINMLLDAEASNNMLLNDEASNNTLLDAKASSNISLLQSSYETLQSLPLFTDTSSILYMHLDNINKQCQIKKSSKSRELLSYQQKKHKKSISLLDDNNFLEECQE
ncbi:3680_t:CDS:2, partial [Cetraspora pellucida]